MHRIMLYISRINKYIKFSLKNLNTFTCILLIMFNLIYDILKKIITSINTKKHAKTRGMKTKVNLINYKLKIN